MPSLAFVTSDISWKPQKYGTQWFFWSISELSVLTETTCRRLHWWRIPCVNAVTKVLKEKVMLFAKALPCRIKHVLSHTSSDQSLSWFSSCNPSDSSEHWHQVNQVGEIVHGCHVLRPTVCYCKMSNVSVSDIVRYCPISMISWWSMKIQQMPPMIW